MGPLAEDFLRDRARPTRTPRQEVLQTDLRNNAVEVARAKLMRAGAKSVRVVEDDRRTGPGAILGATRLPRKMGAGDHVTLVVRDGVVRYARVEESAIAPEAAGSDTVKSQIELEVSNARKSLLEEIQARDRRISELESRAKAAEAHAKAIEELRAEISKLRKPNEPPPEEPRKKK
jgi:hypothetical protein